MTNYDYLKDCEFDEFAAIITTLLVQLWESCNKKFMDLEQIEKNCESFKEWLNQPVVSGEYDN